MAGTAAASPPERKGTEAATQSAVEIYRELIKENIEYDHLLHYSKIDREELDGIVELLVETVCTARKTIRVAGDDYPAELVKAKMPYLLFVWLFGKMGEAWRLAAGADASQKMLHFMDSLAAAFANSLPSLHPFDLCIGIVGAVLVRLAVYLKGKNAKKYRHGAEYGSARWGGAKDIAPYIDPVFENNILLTQTERLTMNGRPKDPKTARNKNVLVIGGSGSGKTRFFVKPNLMQMHSSYCITDPNR